jgi:hypothetical protein
MEKETSTAGIDYCRYRGWNGRPFEKSAGDTGAILVLSMAPNAEILSPTDPRVKSWQTFFRQTSKRIKKTTPMSAIL